MRRAVRLSLSMGPADAPTTTPQTRVESYVVDINFRNMADRKSRDTFLTMVGSFVLPKKDVEALIGEGRRQVIHISET